MSCFPPGFPFLLLLPCSGKGPTDTTAPTCAPRPFTLHSQALNTELTEKAAELNTLQEHGFDVQAEAHPMLLSAS